MKVFQGGDFEPYVKTLRASFQQVQMRKPEASRGQSKEVYLLGKGLQVSPE